MQQLSGASPAQPQAKAMLSQGPAERKETMVPSKKKSSLPLDVTDKNKIFSEEQPLVPGSENPSSTSSKPKASHVKSYQPLKPEPQKEDKGSSISQSLAKATSDLPASVENGTSGKTKSPTVQKQEEMKPADKAPNAQSVIPPSALEKGDTDLSKLYKGCHICKVIFKKDPLNYNTCDSCKAIVCNLCVGLNSKETTEVRKYTDMKYHVRRSSSIILIFFYVKKSYSIIISVFYNFSVLLFLTIKLLLVLLCL